jgi:TonB family protein
VTRILCRCSLVAAALAMAPMTALAQIPSARTSRAPLPAGQVIHAKDGDIVLVDPGTRVRIVRRTEGRARAVYNPSEHWLVLLMDFAGPAGAPPDGRVDSQYSFFDLAGDWPLGERWEGSAAIEEYSLAGEGGRMGVGFRTQGGLVLLLSPVPQGGDVLADPSAVATLTYHGASAGGPGGRLSFEAAEQIAISAATSNAEQRAARASGVTPQPPATPGGDVPVRVGSNIVTPQKIHDVRPTLPPAAAQAGVNGVVILEITIGTDGSVTDAKVLRSIPLLDQAALEAVRQWRYTPTRANGTLVPVIMVVTVNFNP